MIWLAGLALLALAAGVSWVCVKASIPLADRMGLLDTANARSMHEGTIPRSGGVGLIGALLVCAFLVAVIYGYELRALFICGALTIVAAVSLADDRLDLPALIRLGSQAIAAIVVFASGFTIGAVRIPGLELELPPVIGFLITIPFIIWFINLYNFMDGMDGLAGGMGAIGFGWLFVLGSIAGQLEYALLAAAICGASLGFLGHNFPPAKIFMGDLGSISLGFFVALFLLWGEQSGIVRLWAGLMIFSPFFVDATVTLFKRARSGSKVWEAHREHFYQRSVHSIGLSTHRVIATEYLLMTAAGATAVASIYAPLSVQWTAIVVWILLYASIGVFIENKNTN